MTQRREREIAFMNGHFLDMLRGLPTLKLFGRQQGAGRDDRRDRGPLATSSMDVLRTAFQTSLVLEWGATAATALVAIEVSARLMGGDSRVRPRAFAVLMLTPECFAPLRALASHYHTGAAGRAALEAIAAVTGVAEGAGRDGLPSARRSAARSRPAGPWRRVAAARSASPGCRWPIEGREPGAPRRHVHARGGPA